MNLQAFINSVWTQAAQQASFGHTLKFDLEDMGVIWIDAREKRVRGTVFPTKVAELMLENRLIG